MERSGPGAGSFAQEAAEQCQSDSIVLPPPAPRGFLGGQPRSPMLQLRDRGMSPLPQPMEAYPKHPRRFFASPWFSMKSSPSRRKKSRVRIPLTRGAASSWTSLHGSPLRGRVWSGAPLLLVSELIPRFPRPPGRRTFARPSMITLAGILACSSSAWPSTPSSLSFYGVSCGGHNLRRLDSTPCLRYSGTASYPALSSSSPLSFSASRASGSSTCPMPSQMASSSRPSS